ncbi:MAG: AMP-binding protein, partial [Chloroflexota bacterium]|nr:AMP-binding protein [Chloroflexota bacterium]
MSSELDVTIPPRMNISDCCLDENIRASRGEKVGLIADGHPYTYRQVTEMAARVGSALCKLGMQAEQRALLVLSDSAEFVASFFGVTRLGAVPVPVNTMLAPADYAHFLEDSRARVLIVDSDLLPQVPLDSPWLEYVVVVGGHAGHRHSSPDGGPKFLA